MLQSIAQRAGKFCGAHDVQIHVVDGGVLRCIADYGDLPAFARAELIPVSADFVAGKAVLTRKTIHLGGLTRQLRQKRSQLAQNRYHSILVAPLMQAGVAIGTISLGRKQMRPFSAEQVELLKTFANEAAITIENTRLANEHETYKRALTESLERQAATSQILRVISQSQQDVQPVFEAIATNARSLCRARDAGVYMFDGERLHLAAIESTSVEAAQEIQRHWRVPHHPGENNTRTRALATGRAAYIEDVTADPKYELRALAVSTGYRSACSVPLLRDGKPFGLISVTGKEAGLFTDRQIAMLESFADQAAIAVANTRLFNELESRNRDLTEALEQQTATSDILRVISQSHRDVQPVFDAIAANARKLCDATFGMVFTFDGELIHVATTEGSDAERLDILRRVFPSAPTEGTVTGRAIESRSVVYVPDVAADAGYRFREESIASNYRSIVAVPMIRNGSPIGTVNVTGAQPGMFSERQIGMLQTFADQAVIAIENSRLFMTYKPALQNSAVRSRSLEPWAKWEAR